MLNPNVCEPECFVSFKAKNNPHSYLDDCNDYELKKCLREALLVEQKYQCFYCEKKIVNDGSKVHIDHIKQRDVYHNLECSYENMALSCEAKKHCGKYKDTQEIWDDSKFLWIVPQNITLQEKPSDFFVYRRNGEIGLKKTLSDNEKERGDNTIKYLNLNHRELVETRKNIIFQMEMYRESGYVIDEVYGFFGEFESLFREGVKDGETQSFRAFNLYVKRTFTRGKFVYSFTCETI